MKYFAKYKVIISPKGKIAEPEDVAGAVLFLASSAADYITGDTIYVDGGTMTT